MTSNLEISSIWSFRKNQQAFDFITQEKKLNCTKVFISCDRSERFYDYLELISQKKKYFTVTRRAELIETLITRYDVVFLIVRNHKKPFALKKLQQLQLKKVYKKNLLAAVS
ncbi:MAG TPA: hypothetical protein DCL21_04335 [Alphaproteobacteria bacterium]|nr:hypothetical protein [Alphaproteobacteria bacterium]